MALAEGGLMMCSPSRRTPAIASLLSALMLASLGCQPAEETHRRRRPALDADDHDAAATASRIDSEWRREDGWAISPPLEAPSGATRVTALVDLLTADGALPGMFARGLIAGAPATEWVELQAYFAEGETRVAVAELGRVVDGAELRLPESSLEALTHLRWSAVDPASSTEDSAGDVGSTRAALRAELRALGIVTREEWGARSTSCGAVDGSRSRLSIHHTEGPATDPARQMRSVQSYHISKGWCDIGYHFLIGADGRVYEGRAVELLGAHVRNNNSGNLGISFIGCFDSAECSVPTTLTDTMIESAGRLVGSLSELYRITPSSSTVRGHRDQVSTTCPGDRLYDRIDDIIAIGRTTTLAGGPPPSAPAPSEPPPSGAVCRHSLGGVYASGGCSESYQCCEGAWRSRASGCGTCACVEGSGRIGCSDASAPPAAPPPVDPPAAPSPPPGASCTHSFGGAYANSACSTSYQCCDGAWRPRATGCGACLCIEASGTSGCGETTAAPPMASSSLPYAGLTLGGSEIPRAGLANSTLRATLGLATEPYGTIEAYEGVSWVRGRVSWFGGPSDTGVSSTETGAVSGERLRSLNSPLSPSAATLASRPADYYFAAMRWAYAPNGTSWWRTARLLVVNPATGAAIVVRPVDWGPNTSTRRVLDLSPQAIADLGLSTDGEALVAFAPAGASLGRVSATAPAPAPAPGAGSMTLPPVDAGLDYQLGGAYTPRAGVGIVSRDRSAAPAAGLYNICYINGFQIQPGEESWWMAEHPGLMLRDSGGALVIDPDWAEVLIDISTAAKRTELAAVVRGWIVGCASAGFDAVEIDNLDTFSRSGGLVSEDAAVQTMRLFADAAHAAGLAIAQKNSAEIVGRRAEMQTDFVVAEACSRYAECGVYTAGYGEHVLMIEYRRADFSAGCAAYPRHSIILRDVNLVAPSSSGYVYDGC